MFQLRVPEWGRTSAAAVAVPRSPGGHRERQIHCGEHEAAERGERGDFNFWSGNNDSSRCTKCSVSRSVFDPATGSGRLEVRGHGHRQDLPLGLRPGVHPGDRWPLPTTSVAWGGHLKQGEKKNNKKN